MSSPRQRHVHSVAFFQESDGLLIVATDARNNDNVVFLALVVVNGCDMDILYRVVLEIPVPLDEVSDEQQLSPVERSDRDLLWRVTLLKKVERKLCHHFSLLWVDFGHGFFLLLLLELGVQEEKVYFHSKDVWIFLNRFVVSQLRIDLPRQL